MSSSTRVREKPPHLADPEATARRIREFIRSTVEEAAADGVVVNLSGGLDSTVTATLATEALGSERVTGLILPADANRSENIDDARHVAEELVIDHRVVEMQTLIDTFVRTASSISRESPRDPFASSSRVTTVPVKHREHVTTAVGNVAARLRMMVAYFEANTTSSLVLGTGNRTELAIGYFTKHGDGAADLLPIGDLYKTEVRQLARTLDVREAIVEKPPTAGLWDGQADEAELGATYDQIDTILWNLLDGGATIDAVAETLGLDIELVEHILQLHRESHHKRAMPATPSDR